MTDDRAVRLALEVAHLTTERDAERGTVDFLLAQKAELVVEVERLRATVARVEALADEYECGGTCNSEDPEWARCISCRLRAALEPHGKQGPDGRGLLLGGGVHDRAGPDPARRVADRDPEPLTGGALPDDPSAGRAALGPR